SEEPQAWIAQHVRQALQAACVGQLVEDEDARLGLGESEPHEVAADEPGAAGDEDGIHWIWAAPPNVEQRGEYSGIRAGHYLPSVLRRRPVVESAGPAAGPPCQSSKEILQCSEVVRRDADSGRRPVDRPGSHRVPAHQLLGPPDPGSVVPGLARPG